MKKFNIAMLFLALPCMIFADAESDLRHALDQIHNNGCLKIGSDFPNRGQHHEQIRSESRQEIADAETANPNNLGVSKVKNEFESDQLLYTKAAFDQATTSKDVNSILNIEANHIMG
jgi:hypothetical protein